MRVTPGTRIGIYQVTGLIGAGGMGEVYRAEDARLGRSVALKLLPAAFASDSDRLARFEREARALAALNHPCIASIYGIEDANGVRALVLELVEGPTLAQRLQRGALAIEEAVFLATQIAEALEAAHDKGIIHRDLKPANIKQTADGTVKVLDFGLAKALDPSDSRSPSDSPTVTAVGTRAGVVLGTAAYMSPEQARGLPVDKRTDIWAFGCVLYEMLTGRAAFAGETVSDVLARVLEREPDWSRLPAQTPAPLRRLLRRCLAKDSKRRLRDIGDARLDLQDALGPPEAAAPPDPTPAPRRWIVATLGLAVLALSLLALWNATRPPPVAQRSAVRFPLDIRPDQQLPIGPGNPVSLAVSPDGQQLVYAARSTDGNRLYLRGRGEFDATPLPGTEGATGPFFSPDGRSLGFASGGMLRVMPLPDGPPRVIAEAPIFMGGAWISDETIVFTPDYLTGLFKVAADGGRPEPLTTVDAAQGETAHHAPQPLPAGRAALFTVSLQDNSTFVAAVDIATGHRRRLIDGSNPFYLSSGQLVIARGSRLLTAAFDPARLRVDSEPTAALDGIANPGRNGHFAVAPEGTLVYIPAAGGSRRLVWADRNGKVRPVIEDRRAFTHPRLSPDGTRVVVTVPRDAGGNEVWVYDATRGTRSRLSTSAFVSRPVWEPDGKRITVQSDRRLLSISVDDAPDATLLLAPEGQATVLFPLAWSRVGRILAYSRPVPSTNRDVWILPDGEAPQPFVATARDERSAMFSPDGQWLVYSELEAGRDEQVYVQPYPMAGGRVVISPDGGSEPVWSPTGREIFYRSTDGDRLFAVAVRTAPTFSASAPRLLFEGRFAAAPGNFWSNYDLSPDGQQFLLIEDDETAPARLNVVLNWMSELAGVEPTQR